MPKTIRELAEELKVSKQNIQYHYQRLPTKNRQKDSQGKNVISLTAERIIRSKVAKNQQIGSKKTTNTSKENNELIATLRKEVEDLKDQRDKQIAIKDRQIDQLTKLVDQQQQLQLATVAENHQLKEHVQKLSGLSEPSSSIQKRPENDKDDTLLNNINSSQVKDKNYKQDKKKVSKNKVNNSWWHFW